MADKRIVDLPLISTMADDVSLPGDDGIQTYRVTGAQLKPFILSNQAVLLPNLKNDIFDGLSSATVAKDDFVIISDISDSNLTKKVLVEEFSRAEYRSVTTNYTATISDETMSFSGASFNLTLPTAVGIVGKKYKFLHNGTSLTQVYTFLTTSSQTINGILSGVYVLHTNTEVLEIESDGANWIIINHFANTPWSTPAAISVTSTGSSPTKGTTSLDEMHWRRQGNTAEIAFRYVQSSGGAVGSGTYLFGLPTNLTVTSDIDVNTTVSRNGYSLGLCAVQLGDGGAGGSFSINLYSTTRFFIFGHRNDNNAFNSLSSTNIALIGARNISGIFRVPIVGWQP